MAINTQIKMLDPASRITKPLRDAIVFSAPLDGVLDFAGYGTPSFSRTGAGGVVEYRDGFLRTLANNLPRFRYSNGALDGLLLETAATNLCLRSQEFNDAGWVKTNVSVVTNDTATKDPFGTSLAEKLTATAANGTVIRDAGTIASNNKVFGLWLKRATGSGNIQLTLNNGSSWTTVPVSSVWQRFEITASLANPDVGIRIVTSGDAVWAFGAQLEDQKTALSSYIATTSSSATRNADVLTFPSANNLHDGNTLFWRENGIAKSTPAQGNPFNSSGQWIGNTGVAVRSILKASKVCSADEIAYINALPL